MRKVDYTDERGRKYKTLLPDGVSDEEAHLGVPLGPPDVVDEMELPEPFATRLHNELFSRGLYSVKEVQKNPKSLTGALQTALKVDVQILQAAFHRSEKEVVLEQ